MDTKLIQFITVVYSLLFIFSTNQKIVAQCLPSELGSIGNYVWYDTNDNGIQDGIESGASGISVFLMNSQGTIISDTITNSQGYYSFDDLCPNTYNVKFELPSSNYILARQTVGNSFGSDPSIYTGEATFTLTPSENNGDIDAGIVQKRFCGTVWEDVNKDGIKDASDSPLEKVIVYLKNTLDVIVSATTTNSLGEYYFVNVLDGTYYIEFNPATNTNGIVFASGTVKDAAGSAATDIGDSDIDPYTMRTNLILVGSNETACDVGAGFARTPLPVELLSFKAKLDGDDVVLDWVTLSEINNSHFEVEVTTDGRDFRTIGKINGAGDSNESIVYNYRHEKAGLCATLYYRLKQVDFDGTYEYSETIQIKLPCSDKENYYTIYPNPVSGNEINLQIIGYLANDVIDIAIINGQGKLVKKGTVSVEGNNNEIRVNLNDLEAGIYYTLVMNETWKGKAMRFIKVSSF